MATDDRGAQGVRSVCSNPFGFNVLVLVVWHILQDLQNASTSLAMLGHQYQRQGNRASSWQPYDRRCDGPGLSLSRLPSPPWKESPGLRRLGPSVLKVQHPITHGVAGVLLNIHNNL